MNLSIARRDLVTPLKAAAMVGVVIVTYLVFLVSIITVSYLMHG
jgi:hypothetical protein